MLQILSFGGLLKCGLISELGVWGLRRRKRKRRRVDTEREAAESLSKSITIFPNTVVERLCTIYHTSFYSAS